MEYRKLPLPPVRQSSEAGGGSRPSSSGSSTSTCTLVPHILYNDVRTPLSSRSSKSTGRLPSLRHQPYHKGRHSTTSLYEPRSSLYSALYRRSACRTPATTANTPFLQKSFPEECIKCLMKLPHRKCESHKYIRVGGGYRHSYCYVKLLMDELQKQIERQAIQKQRLAAIKEKKVRAIKTIVRTGSGRLIERIVYLDDEDYEAFINGGDEFQKKILQKYLSESDSKGLQSWGKEEVKAIKTYIRTKSGRLKEKLVYVGKKEYDDIKSGKVNAKDVLKKYVTTEEGEEVEGWDDAEMKTITTHVRTKSGRLIEKVIMISKEDYDAMIRDGKDPAEIISKYIPLGEGETVESWKSSEPMKSIKTLIRTKSGKLIEKTVLVSKEDYDRMMKEGGDPTSILSKYLPLGEGEKIEKWEKAPPSGMKVIKTIIRTKSGRLIEKTVMLTEDEYRQFEASGGDPDFLKKFIELGKGEEIADWDKASTVYDASDDEAIQGAVQGERIRGKDGQVYEIVVDPLTGKKYKRKVPQKDSDVDSGIASIKDGTGGKKRYDKKGRRLTVGGTPVETAAERQKRKAGGRHEGSESDYSYQSEVSEGGRRHVKRRHRRADGGYSDPESYHSSADEDGAARRRRRRRERRHGSGSEHSYRSDVSAGGTRTVKRRRKRADGTYSASESYHSSDSGLEGGSKNPLKKSKQKKKREPRIHGSDSEYSYHSDVSEGGTKYRTRQKRLRDKDGKVIGHGKVEDYESPEEDSETETSSGSSYTEVSDGEGGKVMVKKVKSSKKKRGKMGKGGESDDSDDSESDEGMGSGRKRRDKGKTKGSKGEGGKRTKNGQYKNSDDSGSSSEYVDENGVVRKKDELYRKTKDGKTKKKKTRIDSAGNIIVIDSESDSDDSPVFSDVSTESEAVDLEKMTEEEKEEYLLSKAKRKAAREQRRREKYGDDYDAMVEVHLQKKKAKELRKKEKEKYKSMVSYDKMLGRRGSKMEKDDREPGLGHTEWGTKKGKKKAVDGNEADDESEEEYMVGDKKVKRTKRRLPDGTSEDFIYEYDEKGNITKKKRILIREDGTEEVCSEYEYEYGEDGELLEVKKVDRSDSRESDGDYFEMDAEGKLVLKRGKKKIDLDKLGDDELRELGIDPNLSKHEIARLLKERFGDELVIQDGIKKIGTKRLEEYGSDVNTDDLADDSDLDTSTLKGLQRVRVMMKKGGETILQHMYRVMQESDLKDDASKTIDERSSDIDYLAHYKLVDKNKLESYARAFVVEDEKFETVINAKKTRTALDGVQSTQKMTSKQLDYVLKVLKIDEASQVTFRMFAVITALCERVTAMDSMSKHLLEVCDLLDIERKMGLYRSMFYCNTNSDRDTNFITAESLKIELIAGGLSWVQQDYVMGKLHPNAFSEISFLDYLCYIPLFMSMHDNICDHPLDMSSDKYSSKTVRLKSGSQSQRDTNPLGYHLSRDSAFQMKRQARDLADGRIDGSKLSPQKIDLLNKYAKLPDIISSKPAIEKAKSPTFDWGR